jgi:ketosteroid isomerase-like protein
MSKRSLELIRDAIDALNREGPKGILPFLDPEIELRDPDLPGGGSFHGHDGIVDYLAQLEDSFQGFQSEIEELYDAGDRVVGFLRNYGRGRGSGVEVEIRDAHTWTFRAGKIVHWRTYLDRNEALADAGLSDATASGG